MYLAILRLMHFYLLKLIEIFNLEDGIIILITFSLCYLLLEKKYICIYTYIYNCLLSLIVIIDRIAWMPNNKLWCSLNEFKNSCCAYVPRMFKYHL